LTNGLNTFVITSVNSCGSDTKTITINYLNCLSPVVSFLTPTTNGATVTSPIFILDATIQNSNNGQGITYNFNNFNTSNFSFNNSSKKFQSTVNLVAGINTFVISSTNSCGTDTRTITVNYVPCIAPNITILSPASN
jgi:hypothetical protein